MGYSKQGSITNFWPDDTAEEMYVESNNQTMQELLSLAHTKWPHATLDTIKVHGEKIHTNCIYYDLHDPSDYTQFLVLTIQA